MLCHLKYKIVREKGNINYISLGKVKESSFSCWSISLLFFILCCFQTVLQIKSASVCYKNIAFPAAATGRRLKFGSINTKTVPKLSVCWDCF